MEDKDANVIVADILVTQVSRASVAMIPTKFIRNIPVAAPEMLTVNMLNPFKSHKRCNYILHCILELTWLK